MCGIFLVCHEVRISEAGHLMVHYFYRPKIVVMPPSADPLALKHICRIAYYIILKNCAGYTNAAALILAPPIVMSTLWHCWGIL